jgi:A/G-specific adenine glycosylase
MTDKGSDKWFTRNLLKWNKAKNHRSMPWKGEKDPYKIWLSEIILQQTRVEQGLEYYNKFILKYSDIHSLARANEDAVLKLWEGLGYYSRCRNLLKTAKMISLDRKGAFPDTYEEIIKLPGIGPYTAAAISSFAFNRKYAVLDGNVFRVLSRFFAIDFPIDLGAGRALFQNKANQLIDAGSPGLYNQAIMDFGATVCKPLPNCEGCSLNSRCGAYQSDLVAVLPRKSKRMEKKAVWYYYFIVRKKGKYYYRKREDSGIWKGLHEFILYSSVKPMNHEILFQKALHAKPLQVLQISEIRKQQLTHVTVHGSFLHVEMPSSFNMKGYQLATPDELGMKAFPRLITGYLKDNPLE